MAYFIGMPVWLVRLIWFCLIFGYGIGAIAYVLLWIFLPKWDYVPDDYKQRTGD